MKIVKFGFLILNLMVLAACGKAPQTAQVGYATPDAAVKGFMDAVAGEKYDVAWVSLSKHTQNRFSEEVAKDEKMDVTKVKDMFGSNAAPLQNGFWKAFREASKIPEFVKDAKYQVQNTTEQEALVNFTTGTGAVIPCKVYKEGSNWLFGYAETFNI